AGARGGAAHGRLLRGVFSRGVAAGGVEALGAAEAAGQGDWLRGHIAAELAAADEAMAARLEEGSYQHAARRVHEMAAAAELVEELGVVPRVTRASQEQLAELAGG